MLFYITESHRPNRIEEKKDKDYHLRFGRWVLNGLNHPLHQNYVKKSMINWSFYKGNQWIFDEDLEAFFMDESGDIRNRLKFQKNMIRPMVEQYVGNAIRLPYRARAKAQSDYVINKREEELAKLAFYHDARESDDLMEKHIDKSIPLGETREGTMEIFENVFVNEYERDINGLLQWMEKHVDIDQIKFITTKHLAITGLGAYMGSEYNSNYIGEAVDPMYCWFDRSAQKPDLTDAEYQGRWYYHDVPSILERWQDITDEQRRTIEQASKNESTSVNKIVQQFYNHTGSKIPVFETFWKDTEQQWYGWVNDEYGYPFFTLIDHENSAYTTKDLIDAPNDSHKEILGKKKKAKIYVDVLRYCTFIPKEEIGNLGAGSEDIVLEHGILPYEETYWFDPSNVEFPIKFYAWSYDKGEVLSPLDDAIQPQRFINRMLSIAESHVNNMRGSGTVIAKNAIDPRDGEEKIQRNINKGKPITVDITRTGSVQNAIGTYGTDLGGGVNQIFSLVREMQVSLQDVTGINEAMTGTQGDSLVGVIQSQIQRGTLIQEPFYFALTSILKQAYQHMATVGKRIYHDNPRKLTMITGDKGLERINITKEMMLEDFRIFIERSQPKETQLDTTNNLILTLFQMGLIDNNVAANLFNRADADEVATAMRQYQINLKTATNRTDNQQIAAENQMMQAAEQEQEMARLDQEQMMEMQMEESERARQHEIDQTLLRGELQDQRERTRAQLKKDGELNEEDAEIADNIKRMLRSS